ncbi:MAG: response regulator transcription factor [Chloroflexi bacterium]|nr:response regulator transcription factor [Chloroflexota bacterium]MCI0576161.1 response regulator transcription factor [Chloroflexota bacterium]MCI0645430.1 response regulator transcription factor [Chloroflexota bacterium]MCI0731296.1 response regulator transcription factor [Chloroflexota bacterium]
MSFAESIGVMVVDDHRLVRKALAHIIQKQDDFELVAEAADGAEAVRLYAKHRPDVVVMDLDMPVMDGLQATREILQRFPDACIIVVSALMADTYANMAQTAGALYYLDKTVSPEILVDVIHNVHDS